MRPEQGHRTVFSGKLGFCGKVKHEFYADGVAGNQLVQDINKRSKNAMTGIGKLNFVLHISRLMLSSTYMQVWLVL